jgi:eukaryotic-like serine/threonine-protein kinase
MSIPDLLAQALSHRYAIERELGAGGMGTVYLARDLRHDRQVALKVFRPAVEAAVGSERFLREIRLAASLTHPHLLPVFDSGEAGGYLYYVSPYIEGESLRERIQREGPLPIPDAVRILHALADALATAHAAGIVHRDLKPANVLLSGRHALLADFGVAKALDEASGEDELTAFGMTVGTPQYMAPEQAAGEPHVDHRADIYALGILGYEMLTGSPPFQGPSSQGVLAAHLTQPPEPITAKRQGVPPAVADAMMRCLEKRPEDRYQQAAELVGNLEAVTTSAGGMPAVAAPGGVLGSRRRRWVAAGVVAIILGSAGFVAHWIYASSQERQWVAEQLVEIERLADAGRYAAALSLALEVEEVAPDAPTLARLWPRFSATVPIRTDPPGARVYRQRIEDPEAEWEYLGETPLEEMRFSGYTFVHERRRPTLVEDDPARFRFELDGYRDVELLQTAILGWQIFGIAPLDPVQLTPSDSLPEGMVRIPGIRHPGGTSEDFLIGRHEVTNREFLAFVNAGGYREPEYWVEPIVQDGRELEFDEAMALFTDRTGRTGPATWRLGSYPDGQEDYPVGGVSWYEAKAFARWAGKELPTTAHWQVAGRYYWRNSHLILPRSNLEGDGPRPVGQEAAMSTLGLYDVAGNVREWCYNAVPGEGRATMGGAWTDAHFHVRWIIPKDPLDRDETHGFRLARTFDDDTLQARLREPVERTEARDYRAETPASDVEYEIFNRFFEYDPVPLNAEVKRTDTFELWVREEVAFNLPYGERGGAFLYLPKDRSRPLQAVLYWGGSNVLGLRDVDEEFLGDIEFLVRGGRAVVQPAWKGAFHRHDPARPRIRGPYAETTAFRDLTIQWMKDLSSTIDYLETRPDIDEEKLGYYGFSWGGIEAPRVLAVERRIRAAVLNVGGLTTDFRVLPEIDPFNFASRVETPVLMINGKQDSVFPYETSQRPLFELLGTDPEHKKHYVMPGAHLVPRDELMRETLDWFDRYLGPVER